MARFLRRILLALGVALLPAGFCALLTSPISYAVPLNCPAGSQVIGIECFDAGYNNTTPWYRRDFGPSLLAFPLWYAFALAGVWRIQAPPVSDKSFKIIQALLAQGNAEAAVEKVRASSSLGRSQAERYVGALAHVPPGSDPADYAWKVAQQPPPRRPGSRRRAGVPVDPRAWSPTECPHCGGSLASDTVRWISDREARCPFCGGTVKA